MGHNFERLKAYILPLLNAHNFYDAKNEWKLVGVEIQDEWDNCPCGQAIKELCYIYEDEYRFLMHTRRKRKLSDKQIAWK